MGFKLKRLNPWKRTKSLFKDEKVKTKTVPVDDPQGDLAREEASYRNIDTDAAAGAEADSRRAGTYADTKEFKAGLESEAGARARGLKYAAQQRINALRARLGLPASPAGSV